MSERDDNQPPLLIPYSMALDMGPGLETLMAQIRATVEAQTGIPHAWRPQINEDAIRLEPVAL